MNQRRRVEAIGAFAVVLVAATWLGGTSALAGGGGCVEATRGSGAVVTIQQACFTPSILEVDPGTRVRFENRDNVEHNLYGTAWEAGDLAPRSDANVTFDRPGLYPFQCTLHPGMTGAIVVGEALAPGTAPVVEPDRIDLDPEPAVVIRRIPAQVGRTAWVGPALVAVAIGAAGGFAAGSLARRRGGAEAVTPGAGSPPAASPARSRDGSTPP
jgi:plastocyanin